MAANVALPEAVKASVIVPTFNRAHLLDETLAALVAQDFAGPYEIVVVDDGSVDDTPRVLEAWKARAAGRLRTFRQRNAGPATARNRGVAESSGEFLAFVDDDCVAEPSWLRTLLDGVTGAGAAACAGAVVNAEGTWVARYVNREAVIAHVMAADGTVAELITANAGVRADVFRALGGFDETIRVAGGEDTDLSLRLRAAGHRIVLVEAARVFHHGHVTVEAYLRMIHRHGRGRRRVGERFPAYHLSVPLLRLAWVAWPVRAWMWRDYRRYRASGVPSAEALRYVLLRYGENVARMTGYLRGTGRPAASPADDRPVQLQ